MAGSGIAFLWVAIGGALGSVARYGASSFVARTIGAPFPWGTLLVNVTGSLLIGFLAGLMSPDGRFTFTPDARAFLMIGLLGGFTTFSSFSFETLNLARDGQWLSAGTNVVASVVLCLAAVALGHVGGAAIGR